MLSSQVQDRGLRRPRLPVQVSLIGTISNIEYLNSNLCDLSGGGRPPPDYGPYQGPGGGRGGRRY